MGRTVLVGIVEVIKDDAVFLQSSVGQGGALVAGVYKS
jgi:hypothetical protein